MPQTESLPIPKCLSLESVIKQTHISRATVYRLMKRGEFPSSRKIGNRTVWLQSEITHFMNNLPCAYGSSPSTQASNQKNYMGLLGVDE